MLPRSTGLVTFIFFQVSFCFALLGSNFLIYDKNVNKCLKGYQPLKLFYCDSNQLNQQFRWTSNDRILNVQMSRCLGAGSKADGSGLQWYICDETSDLQKWECKNGTLLNLKGTNIFLSQDENTVLKLTQDIGAASQWLIHGTAEGLCSQPYQELYTIKGNAFGRPCHFPFRYEGKWYSDCITKKSTNRLWCSTDRDYQQNWGYCPTKSSERWNTNPLTGVLYQVNENSALTWHQARRSCQQQDSDLLSITEPQEQTFISGITGAFKTIFWIGLNRLNTEKGWQWTNGEPFRYLRWGSGQPNREHGWSCGALSTMETYSWQNKLCSKKLGYICQKGSPKPTSPPGLQVSCSAPWIPYAGHCYFLNRTKSTWKNSNIQCLNAGGHLVSIHDIEEQSFVLSQLGYMETDKLWIGLNDQKTQLLFEWSDQSPVTFTTWDTEEPSHHRSVLEDCVLMGGKDGQWSDEVCASKYGFICKKTGDSTSDTHNDAQSGGCKTGWIRHGYNCYFVGAQTNTFEEAKEICKRSSAYLVDVQNSAENAFLISLVGARPEKHFWIGLSNQRDRYTFEWSNSRNVPYTHWNTRMPGQKQGCVAMTTGTLAGLWDVLSCSNKEKYICKHQAQGVVTTPAPPTSPAPSCAEGWKPLGVRPFCYKFYDMDYYEKKTWFQALDFCRSIGGDLISIHNHFDNFLTGGGYRFDAWIGYSAQDPSVGYTWADGTASSYTNWESGEPDNKHNMENCAMTDMLSMKWNDRSCEVKENFICEINKGVTPKNPANFTIPEHNVTKDGWIEFSGHQYYVYEETYEYDIYEARTFCKKGHGDLVVIETEPERLFLWKLILRHWGSFYIGMTIDINLNMQWIDGTEVIYDRWNEEQPPDEISDETCVIMNVEYGLWSVASCNGGSGFICERHETPPVNATLAPTEALEGGCVPDWTKYRQYCYKTEFSSKTWREAQLICVEEGGNLVSIKSEEEQAFVTTMMLNAPGDLWIGLKSSLSVFWSDGRSVTFTNFKGRHSSDMYPSWHSFDGKLCYKMRLSPSAVTGQWRPAVCNDTNGYICKRAIDSHIVPQTTVLPQSYIKIGNDSFKVESNNLTWWEAKKRCEADGAQLASIRDSITQAYIELQLRKLKQPMWIGLNKNMTGGYFRWTDGWSLNMASWNRQEPRGQLSCVSVDMEGYWNTGPCNQSLPSVCKKSMDIAPTPDTQYPGVCPESSEDETWSPFRGYCYTIIHDRDILSIASMSCMQRGASLLSIEDPEEAKFINGLLEMIQDIYDSVWIGLYKNLRGQWQWLDKTVLDYSNWADNDDWEEDSNYVFISTSDFKWRNTYRYSTRAYICKIAKVPISANSTAKPGPQDTHRSFVMVVLVVIIAVVILLGIAAYMYYKGYRPTLPSRPNFDNPLYFKVSTLADLDNKNLTHDVELE
ncbi:macrophage mannose receptor 1-like isoform X1 [Alosa sapidissima]|uniref:macrophage mannose receptor 1-like isoform X1 n=1 Tax=Alosa sapidissima TaxID=34773 RepID=UPI001C0904C8|nr:macrophage mannose receptor 1-like isoform X1 [Alosa sapidissima]XP_041944965.1 macrophage mannose receptor 1-like isoform X1 [Alosa sapidissima]